MSLLLVQTALLLLCRLLLQPPLLRTDASVARLDGGGMSRTLRYKRVNCRASAEEVRQLEAAGQKSSLARWISEQRYAHPFHIGWLPASPLPHPADPVAIEFRQLDDAASTASFSLWNFWNFGTL